MSTSSQAWSFREFANKFSTLTVADLEQAAGDERSGKPVPNTNARELLRLAFGTTSRVLGSDAPEFAYWRELRATNVFGAHPVSG